MINILNVIYFLVLIGVMIMVMIQYFNFCSFFIKIVFGFFVIVGSFDGVVEKV